jgi:hypothetical protein
LTSPQLINRGQTILKGVAQVPEPSTLALLDAGLIGTGLVIRRRQNKNKLNPYAAGFAAA